jgi:orotate phosphoribosyltransferase
MDNVNSVNVTDAFVFITRATENKLKDIENKLKKLKINLHYIINIKELLEKLEKQECLTPQELKIIKSEQSKS